MTGRCDEGGLGFQCSIRGVIDGICPLCRNRTESALKAFMSLVLIGGGAAVSTVIVHGFDSLTGLLKEPLFWCATGWKSTSDGKEV